jgi:hypothetical protein
LSDELQDSDEDDGGCWGRKYARLGYKESASCHLPLSNLGQFYPVEMAESTSSTSTTPESEKTAQPAPQAPLDTIPAWKWKGSLLVFILTTLINGMSLT